MSTGNKIFIGIILVIVISLLVGFMANKSIDDTEKNAINTVDKQDDMFDLYGGSIENDTENEQAANTVAEDVTNSNYVGQEEAQTSNEDTETAEQKAIRLVKEKYGTTDGVSFNIAHQDEETFRISVNDSQTSEVLAWYTVNTETWHVLEN